MMKKYTLKNLIAVVLIFSVVQISFTGKLTAQEDLSGTVKYSQTTKYDFSFRDDQRWNDFVATLPQEGTYAFILYFDQTHALYEENTDEQDALDPSLQRALGAAHMGKPPKPELKMMYSDPGKNKKYEKMEFMTRDFIIESEIDLPEWKITGEQMKILDYICISAELTGVKDKITAWFTSQIPVSFGPAGYYGLPGLVLAVEKNGATIFMATSVDMIPPEKSKISKPGNGKKVSQQEFDQILEEKEKEFKEQPRGRGHQGGGKR